MKGIYTIFGEVTKKDLELIGEARRVFPYVTVALSLPTTRSDDYTSHRDKVSAIRKMNVYSEGLEMREDDGIVKFGIATNEDCVGLGIDFFEEGQLESFLNRSNAVSWVVSRRISADLVRNINYPKYFIN
jgi:hypothetical protein